MNWFLVKIVYRIICGDGYHTAQFDEQIRLIIAESQKEAIQKGKHIGLQEEETFFNHKQQLVRWKFIDITEVHAMNDMTDGAEVYSQIKETDNADDYCRFVHHKASLLKKQMLSPTRQIA